MPNVVQVCSLIEVFQKKTLVLALLKAHKPLIIWVQVFRG